MWSYLMFRQGQHLNHKTRLLIPLPLKFAHLHGPSEVWKVIMNILFSGHIRRCRKTEFLPIIQFPPWPPFERSNKTPCTCSYFGRNFMKNHVSYKTECGLLVSPIRRVLLVHLQYKNIYYITDKTGNTTHKHEHSIYLCHLNTISVVSLYRWSYDGEDISFCWTNAIPCILGQLERQCQR